MAANEVRVDAKAMSDGLAQSGHIALYGIHFATDSATVTPDSAPTLAQMVRLLKSQPKLNVFIVGHTDDSGALAHNLALSQQRAEMVVKALVARGIDSRRLAAKGLACMRRSPVIRMMPARQKTDGSNWWSSSIAV